MKTLEEFLEARNPFGWDQLLRSISPGVVADETVICNVDAAKEIGVSILNTIENKCVEDYTS